MVLINKNINKLNAYPFDRLRGLLKRKKHNSKIIDMSIGQPLHPVPRFVKEIIYKEKGAIPLFYPLYEKEKNKINIGTAGGMTRLSTGYTFLNIQEHSKYISNNIENISSTKKFEISKKYQFLDDIFLRVLDENPEMMPDIFFKMFKSSPNTVIKFLSNKSNLLEDLSIILKMPKWTFIKALFK